MTRGRVIRTALAATTAIGLGAYSVVFAFRAGCAESAAGMTIKSDELSAYSVWLMLLALPVFGALFATRPSVNGTKALMQAYGFLIIGVPVCVFMLHYVEELGAEGCRKRTTAVETSARQHISNTALMQWPNTHRRGKVSVISAPSTTR